MEVETPYKRHARQLALAYTLASKARKRCHGMMYSVPVVVGTGSQDHKFTTSRIKNTLMQDRRWKKHVA